MPRLLSAAVASRTLPSWLFAAIGAATAVATLGASPTGAALAFLAVGVLGMVAVAYGARRHTTVRGPWHAITGSYAAFIAGIVVRAVLPGASDDPPRLVALVPDVFTVAGYVLLGCSIVAMRRRCRPGTDASTRVDANVIGLGASLAAWTFLISPTLSGGSTHGGLLHVVAAAFPVVDMVLLTFLTQLTFVAGPRTPALWLMVAAVTSMFAGDLLFATHSAGVASVPTGPLNMLFLLGFVGMGAAALHPSMRALTTETTAAPRPLSAARIGALAVSLLIPSVLATLWPSHGPLDAAARLALAALLTSAVIARTVGAVNSHARVEAVAKRQATHDALTGLPNRAALLTHVTAALAGLGDGREVDVMFVDLDGFKLVNDSYGHAVGDELLCAVAGHIRAAVRDGDLVCRVGGDEFVIVVPTSVGSGAPRSLSERFIADFARPFTLSVGDVYVTPSIGIARSHSRSDADGLIRDAHTAMYKVKSTGRNGFTFFDASLRAQMQARLELEQALRGALDNNQLRVFYQPIIDLGTDELTGFEALVRWEHPERGLVSPAEFVPVAEETGLIVPMGAWVLREAAKQLAVWQCSLPEQPLHMSVNVAARQLRDGDLVAEVRRALVESGIDPSTLWLELTESAMVDDADAAADNLAQLRRLGVTIAVDDFGTGYSALGYLKRFPVGIVKIDRSFVDGVGSNSGDETIVKAIVAMAHALGLQVVAEGVETPLQRDRLRELGVEMVQGYLFGRPRPASGFLAPHDRWLAGAA